MDICVHRKSWGGYAPRFSTLWIIVLYSLFIASHEIVQKTVLAVVAVVTVYIWKSTIRCLSVLILTVPNILASRSLVRFLNVLKLLTCTCKVLIKYFLQFFVFKFFWCVRTCMSYPTENCLCKSQQVFCMFQLQISNE